MDVSIIIVNYCGWDVLDECLNALNENNDLNFTFEVIIIDNGPRDPRFKDLQQKFVNFKFYKNSGNNGFSNGNNFGVSKSKGHFFLFLNPDTIASINSVYSLYKLAKNNLNYGIVSCEQINKHGKKQSDSKFSPSFLTINGITRAIYRFLNKRKLEKKYAVDNDLISPEWISGSVILMSRVWYKRIGGWDEDFWLYYEDVDLCKRVLDLDGKIVVQRKIKIIHEHGGSSRINVKTKVLTKTEVIISRHVYFNKHFKGYKSFFLHLITITCVLTEKLLLATLAMILFFLPKLKIHKLLFISIIKYYSSVFIDRNWLSVRSVNYN